MKSDLEVDFTAVGTDKTERETFVAAALTVGFELAENTPGISNVYSIEKRPEAGEAGDVKFYLPTSYGGLSIQHLAQIWLDPLQSMRDAEGLPARIKQSREHHQQKIFSEVFEETYLFAAVAHIRMYSKGAIKIPDVYTISDEEKHSLSILDTFQGRFKTHRNEKELAALIKEMIKHWKPAMVGWIKAYREHLLELQNLWLEAPAAIKIERPGQQPLIIPKGKNFKTLLNRWT